MHRPTRTLAPHNTCTLPMCLLKEGPKRDVSSFTRRQLSSDCAAALMSVDDDLEHVDLRERT